MKGFMKVLLKVMILIFVAGIAFSVQASDQTDESFLRDADDVKIGDANGDGYVNDADAEFLVWYFAGWKNIELESIHSYTLDIDRNGFITRKDAMLLSRYVNGWESYDVYFPDGPLFVETIDFTEDEENDLIYVDVTFAELLENKTFSLLVLGENVDSLDSPVMPTLVYMDQITYSEKGVYRFSISRENLEASSEAMSSIGKILYFKIGMEGYDIPVTQAVVLAV